MAEEHDILDAREAARFLGVHEETLRRLAREKKIPAYKLGGGWRFNKSFLYRWADSQQANRRRKHILVVDDEQTVREVIGRVLQKASFDVTSAASGAEALEEIAKETPDLILLDLKMPDMDGPATLAEIRENVGDVPVIVITGYPDSDLMARALERGPIMLLTKPVAPRQLIQTVRMVLEGAGEAVLQDAGGRAPAD